jgi:TonB family protein
MNSLKASFFCGLLVIFAHGLAWLLLFIHWGGGQNLRVNVAQETQEDITTYIVDELPSLDTVPFPEIKLTESTIEVTELSQVNFEDAEQGDISGVVAAASAPRLTTACAHSCNPSQFARAAGLRLGEVVTIVLAIDVSADGSTGSVAVVRGCGRIAVDAAATRYAKSLHWIPGTKNQKPLSARVRFPVTLVGAS